SPPRPPFSFNRTSPTETYTLSLHDALPISFTAQLIRSRLAPNLEWPVLHEISPLQPVGLYHFQAEWIPVTHSIPESHGILLQVRSEEHTSELQSRENLVCRLLLEKKKIELQ